MLKRKKFKKIDYYSSLIKFVFLNIGFLIFFTYLISLSKFFSYSYFNPFKNLNFMLLLITFFYFSSLIFIKFRVFNFIFLPLAVIIERLINESIIGFFYLLSLIINPFKLENDYLFVPYGLIFYLSYFLTQKNKIKKILIFTFINFLILLVITNFIVYFYNKRSYFSIVFSILLILYLIIYPYFEEKLEKYIIKFLKKYKKWNLMK